MTGLRVPYNGSTSGRCREGALCFAGRSWGEIVEKKVTDYHTTVVQYVEIHLGTVYIKKETYLA